MCAPDASRALHLRWSILAAPPLPPVAEVWAVAFDRSSANLAIKSTIAYGAATFAASALAIDIDGSTLGLSRSRGALSSGRGTVVWDLALGAPRALPILHLPRPLYRDGVPPASKRVTLIADARATGTACVGGGSEPVTWSIDGWPMMLGHRWGPKHHELAAWTHCNAFDVPDLVFEAASARTRVGPLLSPMTTAAWIRWNDERWDLASARSLTQNRGSVSLRRYEMTGADQSLRVSYEVAAETDDLVGIHDPNPTGPMTYRLEAGLARARLEIQRGKEHIVATSRAASLEIATMDSEHGIRMSL